MKFLKFFLLLLFCSCILVTITAKFYEKGILKYSRPGDKIESVFQKEAYDVLYLGSSRCQLTIDPNIVDSLTGIKTYNFGINGGKIVETKLMYDCYIEHHTPPKLIIIDISQNAFNLIDRPVYNIDNYYPYLKDSVISSELHIFPTVNTIEKFSFFQPIMRLFHADDMSRIGALMGLRGKVDKQVNYSKGYTQNGFDHMDSLNFDISYKTSPPIENRGKEYLSDIITEAKSKNTKVVLYYAPEYRKSQNSSNATFFKYIKSLSLTYQLPFWDFRDCWISDDASLFANPLHLNKYGADKFSVIIADSLKHYYN